MSDAGVEPVAETALILRERKHARIFFAVGWVLILANLVTAAYSIFLPIELILRGIYPDGLFAYWFGYERPGVYFDYEEQLPFINVVVVLFIALWLFMFIQIVLLPKIGKKLTLDMEEVAAADSALSLARLGAFLAFGLMTLTSVVVLRTYTQWHADYEVIQSLLGQ